MAASIRRCYCGSERIIKSVLLELDGSIPSSDDWRRQLVERAANVGPHGRPPLLDENLTKMFHNLLCFLIDESSDFIRDIDSELVHQKAAVMVNLVKALDDRICGVIGKGT